VLSVDGRPVLDAASLREQIRASSAASEPAMDWLIERAEQRLAVRVEPRQVSDAGQRVGRIDAYIGQGPQMTTVQLGPWAGLAAGVERTWDMSVLSLRMIGRMVTGQASLRQLSGPLTIADYAGQSALQGVAYYLQFLALVSVSLGVLNLLPLPMLDGGHLLYYVYEGVIGRPISDLWLTWLQRGGAVVLLLMMSIALSNDVARLLGLQ
jgi:regulator of sigma E protease